MQAERPSQQAESVYYSHLVLDQGPSQSAGWGLGAEQMTTGHDSDRVSLLCAPK